MWRIINEGVCTLVDVATCVFLTFRRSLHSVHTYTRDHNNDLLRFAVVKLLVFVPLFNATQKI